MSNSGYNKKDFYHRKAKEEGYAARSAYKIEEIQKKFKLIKKNGKVLDLGCAPGAWVQMALPMVGEKGFIVGVDYEKVEIKHPNFRFIQADAFKLTMEELREGPFDVVLSDMAPKTSGVKIRDHALSVELCMRAIEVAEKLCKKNGNIVVKIFEGEDTVKVRTAIEQAYQTVKIFKPQSSRQASFEVYIIGIGKKA